MTHVKKHTAQLLKEKGFDLPSRQYFISNEEDVRNTHDNFPINWNKYDDMFSAPALHEAADWLRETKGVHVGVLQDNYDRWFYMIESVPRTKNPNCIVSTERYKTHDTGIEAGIVHALKNYVK